MYKCEICNKEFESKFAVGPHKYISHNPNYVKPSNGLAGKSSWNKGLTVETSASVKAIRETQIKNLKSGEVIHSGLGKSRSKETKQKISESTKLLWTPEKRQQASEKMTERLESLPNGHYTGTGISKHGWYKNIYCDSSWELAFILFCHDHGKNIVRCKERRKYIFKEKEHNYYPDFVVDEKIIEIKGYNSEKWKAKHLSNPDIDVLFFKEMQPILSFVKQKYGNDFIKLYEKKE